MQLADSHRSYKRTELGLVKVRDAFEFNAIVL